MTKNILSQVFVEEINNSPKEALKFMSKESPLKRTLRNCKGRMCSKNPQNVSELSYIKMNAFY